MLAKMAGQLFKNAQRRHRGEESCARRQRGGVLWR
jgi:hypothetical protein